MALIIIPTTFNTPSLSNDGSNLKMLLWPEIALPFSSVLISLWNALLWCSLMTAVSHFCSRFISAIGPSAFACYFFARYNNAWLHFMMTAVILLIFFHEDVFSKAFMFTLDDTRLTFKEHFTSTSVSLNIWTSFSTGQVCSSSHKNCDPHLPKLNTSLRSSHLLNQKLDCLYLALTSIDWPQYFHEFAGFCWQQMSWFLCSISDITK